MNFSPCRMPERTRIWTTAQKHALPKDGREELFFGHHHAGRIAGTKNFQDKCLLLQRRERTDRRVRSGEVLVGREWENRSDSLTTDNGTLPGLLSVRVRIGAAERQLHLPVYFGLLHLSEIYGYSEIKAQQPERLVRRRCSAKADESPAVGQPGGNDTQKRTQTQPQAFHRPPAGFGFLLAVLQNRVAPELSDKDMGIWVDYLRMLDRCGKDLHNAHYVCPADLCVEHDKYQEKVRILRKQEERKEQIKIAM